MASKRRVRRKVCGSKQRLSRDMAERKAQSFRQRLQEYVRPYRCRFCGTWHFGHA